MASISMRVPKPGEEYKQKSQDQRAILHYWRLRSALENIAQSTQHHDCCTDNLKLLTQQATISAEVFGEYLSDRLEVSMYDELNPSNSTIAERAMRIPEIVEGILSYASIADILKMYGVCKNLRNIIESSHPLQTQLFLKADESSNLRMVPSSIIWPLEIRYLDEGNGPEEPSLLFSMDVNVENPVSRSERRFFQMFVCQPPIKRLCFYPCKEHPLYRSRDIFSTTGFTIGELHQKAAEAHNEKRCPKCFSTDKTYWPSYIEALFESFPSRRQWKMRRKA